MFPVFGGLLIAYYIRGLRFENVYKTILYTPFTISFVATGVIWTYIYGRDLGVLNGVLSLFDISKVNWLTDYQINNISLLIAWTWQQLGVNLVLYLMGLATIPKEPVESAMIEGANKFQIFIFIIIPMLKPISVIVITMAMVNSFKVFDLIYVVTRGGPAKSTETLAITMFRESFVMFNMGYGSAISIILTMIILLISFFYMKKSISTETIHI
jgi:multiple sugar transport system permease protein